jgi:hypothetical protein
MQICEFLLPARFEKMASRVLPSGALTTSRLVVKIPRLLDELQRPVERFGAAIERHFKEARKQRAAQDAPRVFVLNVVAGSSPVGDLARVTAAAARA